jgi:hypothetical protein
MVAEIGTAPSDLRIAASVTRPRPRSLLALEPRHGGFGVSSGARFRDRISGPTDGPSRS